MFSIIPIALTTLTFSTILVSGASIAERVGQLRLAPTAVQRVNLLEDQDVRIHTTLVQQIRFIYMGSSVCVRFFAP